MITKFKIFENNNLPKEGDYVIFNFWKELTIGKITELRDPSYTYRYFVQEFDKIYNNSGTSLSITEIIEWSENKEELELKLQAKKYNL